jgi:hypothetical protein
MEKFLRQSGTILRGQLQSFDFEFLGADDSTILPRADTLARNTAVWSLYRPVGSGRDLALTIGVE